jgi:hypothetical protein
MGEFIMITKHNCYQHFNMKIAVQKITFEEVQRRAWERGEGKGH